MALQTRKLGVFPAFHKVEGRNVVVVGGGDAAAAKIRLLAETRANVVLYAGSLEKDTGAALIAAHGEWRGALPVVADLKGAALVFVATGSADIDASVRHIAAEAGVPVNVVDCPELCDFYTPALVNRAPLAVAIGSEGVAPVLTRHVRARIEALLAPAFGDLAGLAERLRRRVGESLATFGDRRRYWARFFSGSIAEKVFAGRMAEAESEALQLLEIDPVRTGHVSLVGAGPGAEDLLTLRAQRALQEADVIVYDRLVPDAIVAMGRRDARRIYVGKAKGDHAMSQRAVNSLLVKEARAGHRVVRLKSGDPLIYGRAGEEMAALRATGISFDVVPGITAAFAAAAENEIPLTLRETSSSLVFATGHDANGETLPDWAKLALTGSTVAVYMGRSVAAGVAARLVEAGLSAATPAAVIENASRADKRAYAGRLDQLADMTAKPELSGPVLIIIGDVVAKGAIGVAPAALSELAA